MAELRIAVIDDDWYRREHMRQELDRSPQIRVVHAIDQDTAAAWTDDQWAAVDVAVVDVFDDAAPMETGTDLFSGVVALERLGELGVRTIAVTPHRNHPLVEQRIFQAGADHVYRRWEVNDVERLEAIILNPDDTRSPTPVPPRVLRRFGADQARTNRAVAAYERSALYGRLYEGVTHRSVLVSRRTVDGFTRTIRRTKFYAPPPADSPDLRQPARWIHVRDYLLVLLGRRDAPPTDGDGHDDLWVQ